MDITQILGWIATFLFSIMIIPQMVRTLRTRDTKGVSLLLFAIFLIANIIALIYAILIGQGPLIIKYIIAIETTLAYIGIFAYFSVKKRKTRS
ncbi:PQ-loop repeat-containing protein [Candidatus Woesearchaeota archaeon]|nr:PQ-loop repeat-containing protein [Candidatus Woesearchaeota archaeon]